MKYYLVSLKDNQQVIASDEEIDSNKMDDLVFADNKILTVAKYFYGLQEKVYTKPLKIIAGLEGLPSISFSELNQIPEVDFDAIRFVDVEKLADDIADKKYGGGQSPSYFAGFEDGYREAIEQFIGKATTKPKIFEIEVEMEDYREAGHNLEQRVKIEINNEISILKILQEL